jgi:hypothetical protein
MKELALIQFDPMQCRIELDRFKTLLESKAELSERQDVLPLFKASPNLLALWGMEFSGVGVATNVANEFQIFGDFAADIVIGNREKQIYCLVELEDARPNSIFNKIDGRATSEWGRRFERGFGQMIDWFYAFDDHKNSAGFAKHFGFGHVEFYGMLVIGRSNAISLPDRNRLRWRSDRVTINTHKVSCRTYDELYEDLQNDWQLLSLTSQQ